MRSALSECTTSNTWRSTQINRVNWRELMTENSPQLAPPFFVVHVGKPALADGALDAITYKYPVCVYGVYSTTDANAKISSGPDRYDIASYAWNRAIVLMRALAANSGGATGNAFFVADDAPVVSIAEDNAANNQYFKQNAPLFAFSLDCNIMVGST